MSPLTVQSGVVPGYLLQWLISEDFPNFAADHEGRTVVPKINQTGLSRTPVPLPPQPQQQEIDARLSGLFARTETIGRDATRALTLFDLLERSLLTRTWRGELLPQDLAHESAAALLTRLQPEPASSAKRLAWRAA